MRIAMVITSYHPIVGGAERQLQQVASRMAAAGHDVHVLTRHHPGLAPEEVIGGARVHRIAVPGPKAAAGAIFIVAAALRLRELAPDVIHSHSLFSPALAAALGKRLARAPLVAKPMMGGEARQIYRKPFGRCRIAHLGQTVDRFIAVSGEIRDELVALGVAPDRVVFIPNGVDLVRFRPPGPGEKDELRRLQELPVGPLVLYAGRFAAQKRVPLLIAAWRTARTPGATLLLAGTARGDMPQDVGGSEVPGLRLLGVVEDMPSLLRAVDLFVLPSASEGLSNALLEACASGLPVLASRVGGTEDVIVDGENGVLFPVDDQAALHDALQRLLRDDGLRTRLGASARATVEERYDLDVTARELLALYRQVIAASRSGTATTEPGTTETLQ
jgi:glycosyltransferase involved in cell wall biosynthesis